MKLLANIIRLCQDGIVQHHKQKHLRNATLLNVLERME